MFELLDFVQKELVGVLPVDAVLMKLLDHIVEEARQHASALTDSDLEKLLQEKYVRIGATHGFDKTKGQRYSDHIKYVLKTVQAQTCFVMEMMANNLIDFARPGSEDFIARAIRV
ncbi:unnamed protein product, partial [Symbiodinium microadriaticum]